MKGLGYRIRLFREWKGLTQAELEKRTGINRRYLARVESGEHTNLTFNTIQKIAQGIGVSVSELINHETPESHLITPSDEAANRSNAEPLLLLPPHPNGSPSIPIINRQSVSSEARYAMDTICRHILIDRGCQAAQAVENKHVCFWVDSNDRSMIPAIPPNSLVCLDTTQRNPTDLEGKLVLLKENQDKFVVRQLRREGDFILGIPQNMSLYAPLVISSRDRDAIIGRVIWSWAKLDE